MRQDARVRIDPDPDAGLATITLDRPAALNALDLDLADELRRALATIEQDESVRTVVLTGSGRGFCSGVDVDVMIGDGERAGPDLGELVRRDFHPLLRAVRALSIPVIAAVNGVAAGAGLALACACDIRFATASATFRPAWTAVGLAPDMGAGLLLPRLIGHGRAFEFLASGRVIDAAEALRIGLVSMVWADDEFAERSMEYARALAAVPRVSLAFTKAQLDASWEVDRDTFLALEADQQSRAGSTSDHRDRVAAFRARRTARSGGG